MTTVLSALLILALIGTASSTVFLAMALVASVRHLRWARAERQKAEIADSALPPVAIFKPLHGDEPRLEENLESFFRQDYPDFEIIFGCRNAADAALAVVERVRARHPRVSTRVVLSGDPAWPSAKVWSLDRMIAASTRQFLVISDSDILVRPDFLRAVVTPLLEPRTGLVTCLYRGVPARGIWSTLEALGMSVEMPSESLRQTFATQVRWMQSTRYSRPKGHLGTGLTFAVPFGLLGLAAAAALGHPALGLALFAASLANRIVQCAVVGYGVLGDRRALRLCWLYPLRDLLGFIVWFASYCGGSSFRWRGELYRFTPGGRIVSVSRSEKEV